MLAGFSFKDNFAENCLDCDSSCDCCNCVDNYLIIGNVFCFVVADAVAVLDASTITASGVNAVIVVVVAAAVVVIAVAIPSLDSVSKTILPKIVWIATRVAIAVIELTIT